MRKHFSRTSKFTPLSLLDSYAYVFEVTGASNKSRGAKCISGLSFLKLQNAEKNGEACHPIQWDRLITWFISHPVAPNTTKNWKNCTLISPQRLNNKFQNFIISLLYLF